MLPRSTRTTKRPHDGHTRVVTSTSTSGGPTVVLGMCGVVRKGTGVVLLLVFGRSSSCLVSGTLILVSLWFAYCTTHREHGPDQPLSSSTSFTSSLSVLLGEISRVEAGPRQGPKHLCPVGGSRGQQGLHAGSNVIQVCTTHLKEPQTRCEQQVRLPWRYRDGPSSPL